MARKCCVPRCRTNRTNYDQLARRSCFQFPKDAERRAEWLKVIGKPDSYNTKHTGVCSLHFEEKFIRYTSHASRRLENNAVPNLLLPQTVPTTVKLLDVKQEIAEIMNFDDLRGHLMEKLKLKNWFVMRSRENLQIFSLNKKWNGNLSIRNTICVDNSLIVRVFGEKGDDTIFKFKLFRWHQLQTLLDQLNSNVNREVTNDLRIDQPTYTGSFEFCSTNIKSDVSDNVRRRGDQSF